MKKLLFSVSIVLLTSMIVNSAVPERKGWWKFDNPADMLHATLGLDLVLTGTQTSVAGPVEGNLATQIGVGSYLSMSHSIPPNLGGSYLNEFSLQIDFSVPDLDVWHSFIQTNPGNSNDADLFTNSDNQIGVGDLGYSEKTISANTWYRMVLSVKNGEFFKIYINGELWIDGAGQPLDARYGIEPELVLFGDNDGEDATINCAEVAIWDVALSANEAGELGNASTPTGIQHHLSTKINSDLEQNFPNPFSEITTFNYRVTQQGNVSFVVLNAIGQSIQEIRMGNLTAGDYQLQLSGELMENGVYYLQMINNDRICTRKIIVWK